MTTVNKTLLGLLVIQIALVAVNFTSAPDPLGRAAASRIFPGLEPESVTALTIYGPSADGEGQEVMALSRKGDEWVVSGADDFPAKKTEVEQLLEKLTKLKARTPVLTGAVYHDKVEVSEAKYRRKLSITTGGETITAYLGTSPSTNNVHIRRDGEDDVYQVTGMTESDAGARAWSWVERNYVNIPKDDVWSLTLENEHGTIQLDRDPGTNTWAVVGSTLAASKTDIDGLINDVREIGLETPVGKTAEASFELGKGARVRMTTGTSTIPGALPKETKVVTLEVGAKVQDKDRRYLKASTSDYVVQAADWELKKLVETKVKDLTEEPEPPEPEDAVPPAGTSLDLPDLDLPTGTPSETAPLEVPDLDLPDLEPPTGLEPEKTETPAPKPTSEATEDPAPSEPAAAPSEPEAAPSEPAAAPSEPEVAPSKPAGAPSEPAKAAPAEPEAAPSEPAAAPEAAAPASEPAAEAPAPAATTSTLSK